MEESVENSSETRFSTKQTTDSVLRNKESSSSDNLFVIARCQRNKEVIPNQNTSTSNNQESSEDSDIEELYVLDEIIDRPPEHQIFVSLFRQVEPIKVLLDGKTQGTFVSAVKAIVFNNETNDDGRCKLIFISAKEYNYEACKRRILTLSLPHEPHNGTEEERTMFLRTAVDFSQVQSVHALGALLRYLDLNWSNLTLNMQSKPQFLSLKRISLADIVTIDEDTYRGLQVFSSLAHPSSFKKGVQGSNKEGLSLFQLFSKCSSRVGHSRLRYSRPFHFQGILAKIKALSAKPYQWKSLYNTLYNAVLICELCENAGSSSEILQQLASCDNHNLYEMALCMNRIIDFDLSKSEGKFTVKAGVDPDLDLKKQTMASLHGLMSETAKVELDRLPAFVEECTMLYMPHLGYLLGVKAWADNLTMQQKELPNMKFMFQNNDYIHYKSKGCEELDVMIGDTYPEIVAHETRIMMRLTAVMLENLHTLASVIDKCAELDCLIAIAKVCKELNFVRPTLTTEKVIKVKQGKHPLYVTTCDNFVPNDAESSRDAGFVKILTAPNSAGKSVYLKQTGLIVYLAHIGSFVPAESAEIGIVSHIYSRIQSTECVAAHMSAFLIDLRQMALALQESTSNSLIIVDEFGKGTSEIDGLALLSACLNTLLFRGEQCPHVFLSTHFLNIKEYVLDTPIVKFLTLEYVIRGGEPVFLFRVITGSGDRGGGYGCAPGLERMRTRAMAIADAVQNNTLPPPEKKIQTKINYAIEKLKNDLIAEEI
ncbi:unnamed protein product [Parnassius apollo]|uniref:(apollo) hypothetical protein n=1 Tax=Parnassius apollo TaxID=110799 RepID=A0A8S3WBH4_PARAO|nr:unnamed protein product [Parnassius apollo]